MDLCVPFFWSLPFCSPEILQVWQRKSPLCSLSVHLSLFIAPAFSAFPISFVIMSENTKNPTLEYVEGPMTRGRRRQLEVQAELESLRVQPLAYLARAPPSPSTDTTAASTAAETPADQADTDSFESRRASLGLRMPLFRCHLFFLSLGVGS